MLVADDDRRYTAVNAAACLLLRLPEEQVLRMRIEDLTPPEYREHVEPLWEAFIREGVQNGIFELQLPDGARVEVDYSAIANVEPGRHLSILMFPAGEGGEATEAGEGGKPAPRSAGAETSPPRETLLTPREREVLGMIAAGRGTAWIAAELGVAAATVETHVRHCLEKLGARNRAHAIALGLRGGEISLDLGSAHPRYWG